MPLIVHSATTAAVAADLGAAMPCTEATAELLRAEVTARGVAHKTTVLRAVAEHHLAPLPASQVTRVAEELVLSGDLLTLPGGKWAGAPLRCVLLCPETARVLAGASARRLGYWLGETPVLAGARRYLPWSPALAARLAAVGGIALTADMWARLDREPPADAAFLAYLARQEACADSGQAGQSPTDAKWLAWIALNGQIRWRKATGGARLWRTDGRNGQFAYAWTVGDPPAKTFHRISADSAARAQFALAQQAGASAVASLEPVDADFALRLPFRLPMAEFRWLQLYAVWLQAPRLGRHWRFRSDYRERVAAMLLNRLGVHSVAATASIPQSKAALSTGRPTPVAPTTLGLGAEP